MFDFFTIIKYYYKYIIRIEYGFTETERIEISKAISGSLLEKILRNLDLGSSEINVYFTKESRIYTI